MERCNDGRKKRKRVEGYNLAANKIRDARCERNRGIERVEYKFEFDEERMNKQGEKVEYERKIYSLKKEVKRKKKYDNYRYMKKKEEKALMAKIVKEEKKKYDNYRHMKKKEEKALMAKIVKEEKKKMEYDKDRYMKKG